LIASFTVMRLASAAGVVVTSVMVYRILDPAEDCDVTTTNWATYIAILTAGCAFAGAGYLFVPSRWNLAVRLGLAIALDVGATFCFFVLAVWTWVAKCSN